MPLLRLATLLPSTVAALIWTDPAGFTDKVSQRFRGTGSGRIHAVAEALRRLGLLQGTRDSKAAQLEKRGELTRALEHASPLLANRIRFTLDELHTGPQDLRIQAAPLPRDHAGAVTGTTGRTIDRPLRVLAPLTNSLPYTQSGYSLRSHGLLGAIAARGIAVDALTRPGYPVRIGHLPSATIDVIDGVRYHRNLPAFAPVSAQANMESAAQAICDLAAITRPDVIHTTSNFRNGVAAGAAARALGVPWIYEVRGQEERTWLSRLPRAQQGAAQSSEFYRLAHAQEQRCIAEADHVIVLSQVLADSLVAQGHPREKISIVPNAVEESIFLDDDRREDARRRLGLPAGPLVGTVSALVGYEGLDYLIRALEFLPDQYRVLLVGDGSDRPRLERLAEELGFGERVIFAGRQPAAEVWQWYRALDVFVVPRRDTEVCRTVTPIKPVAAQALGVPVVASDLPALREVTGGCALYPPADDAAALARAIIAAGNEVDVDAARAFAETRTWSKLAEQVEGIYRSLL